MSKYIYIYIKGGGVRTSSACHYRLREGAGGRRHVAMVTRDGKSKWGVVVSDG